MSHATRDRFFRARECGERRAPFVDAAAFSLLEVVVALLLLTLALMAYLLSLGQGAALAAAARDRRLAREEILTGSATGNASQGRCRRSDRVVAADEGVGWTWVVVECGPMSNRSEDAGHRSLEPGPFAAGLLVVQ